MTQTEKGSIRLDEVATQIRVWMGSPLRTSDIIANILDLAAYHDFVVVAAEEDSDPSTFAVYQQTTRGEVFVGIDLAISEAFRKAFTQWHAMGAECSFSEAEESVGLASIHEVNQAGFDIIIGDIMAEDAFEFYEASTFDSDSPEEDDDDIDIEALFGDLHTQDGARDLKEFADDYGSQFAFEQTTETLVFSNALFVANIKFVAPSGEEDGCFQATVSSHDGENDSELSDDYPTVAAAVRAVAEEVDSWDPAED